jgi:hypothetical protein
MQLRPLLACLALSVAPLCGSAVYISNCSLGPIGGPVTHDSGAGYCDAVYSDGSGPVEISGLALDDSYLPFNGSLGVAATVFSDGPTQQELAFSIISKAYETFGTAGPSRTGVISYELLSANNDTGSSGIGISDGIHTYGRGSCLACGYPQPIYTAPFQLGTVFSALAYVDESGTFTTATFLNGGAGINFFLFEADGVTPVSILDAPEGTPGIPVIVNAPEPCTLGLEFITLVAGAAVAVRRQRERRLDSISCG